jgi:uncharacterized repeat protein (TIGR02059 family)
MKYTLAVILLLATAVLSAQTNLTIEGQSYSNTDDTWYGVNIKRTQPTALIFRNNSISSVNRYGYLLSAGDEAPGPYNNNLNGALISGNMITWNGTPTPGIIPHGIFTGYNINVRVKYNYLNRVPMAIIRKSDGMTDVSGAVAYNIIKDPGAGVVVKGMNGVKIYNNTFYSSLTSSQTNRALVEIYENPSVTPAGSATGTKIFNNVFYTKNNIKNISITAACLSGFESDYNVFYCESGTPVFSVDGARKTFPEWQAMGYDLHSVVINPGFKDLVGFVPAKRLDYGKDLGTTWAEGLSVNAKWGTTSPGTTQQNGRWQAGAVIYEAVTTPPPPVEIPVYSGSVINEAAPSRVDMTFSLSLASVIPSASAFTITVNGSARAVSTVSVSGTRVYLTLASPVAYGDRITVAYTKPSSSPLQTPEGGQAASFTARDVTNNVAGVIPVYVSSVIENASPSTLTLTYNISLASIVPAASAFSVRVNSTARSISSVAISGTKVTLTLSSPVVYGDDVTIAYTKSAVNPLQTSDGGQAESFAARTVTNNRTAPVNSPPSINISSPTKSTSFVAPATISIDASASDPDGTVVKVEFFNGTVKLGERTSAPWSFTWKDVREGTYSITATATDNTSSKTVSSPVSVVVEKAAQTINQAPAIAITSPLHCDSFDTPVTITLTAEASDPDGSVTRVEYYMGEVLLGESYTPPYPYSFQSDTAGIFQIKAVAYDNLNASTFSVPIVISISLKKSYADLVNLYPSPNAGLFTVDFDPDAEFSTDVWLTVLSLDGKTVYSDILETGEVTSNIDISDSFPGVYIMKISDYRGILTTKRFIKY